MTRHRRIALIGAALILGGNAIALIGVAYNRSGAPDAVVELSQRELGAPYRFSSKENSGVAFRLIWRTGDMAQLGYLTLPGTANTPWFNKDKLAELGFDVSADPQDPGAARRYGNTLPRNAYVVLEFNGPAYQAALQKRQAERDEALALQANNPGNQEFDNRVSLAQTNLDNERRTSSRLFAVDVGADRETLRGRYPDRARYLILSGQVRLGSYNRTLVGYISGLNVSAINVPLEYRAVVAGGERGGPRNFTVRLAYGKRGEPWILEARAVGNENP